MDLPATGMPANVGGVRIDPPVTNLPNRGGADPHGKLSNVPEALALVLAFVRDQRLIDVCNRQPCQSR